MHRHIPAALGLLIFILGPAAAADPELSRAARSILSNKCFTCHGPDAETRATDLRLDTEEGLTADLGGYGAVSPGKPEQSELLDRIRSDDESVRMPPPDSKLSLSPKEIDTLRRWIADGATFAEHWAFRALRSPVPPAVEQHADWARNPIDLFVLRRLNDAQLAPSPEATRHTLIRRVHLDLLGLPPTPEAVAAFVEDGRPGAYERMLDRVLASPHYGERWGRHWLDQARYADTHGYTIDSERSMWPYRDWVIAALNRDMPFDQFTIEQLAGDLLPSPTNKQLVATGFHRNTLVNQEGGSDREQFRNEAVVDRVNTTGSVWLGLTVGCAQCHSHKFDPITQQDYYQLFAFFNSQQDANGVSPTLRITAPGDQRQLDNLESAVAAAEQALQAYDRQQNDRRAAAEKSQGKPVWRPLRLASIESAGGASFKALEDGSWVASGSNADQDAYSLKAAELPPLDGRFTALRIETLTHPSLPNGGPGRAGNGNFVLNEINLSLNDVPAKWRHATADHSQEKYPVAAAIDDDIKTGWAINVRQGRMNVNRTATFVTEPLDVPENAEATIELMFGDTPPGYNIGRFRLSVTDAPLADLDLPDAERSALKAQIAKAKKAREDFVKSMPTTMIMRELDKPRTTHVHIRGDFLRKGEEVRPDVPASLPDLSAADAVSDDQGELPDRLDLARWLVDDRNPLTARVRVNRIWNRLFGLGLVETENDFGMQSVPPSHPLLLDWLAAEFRESGWSVKRLQRTILTSAVYRQSSQHRDDLSAADPLNKLLGRQNRIRVDAEIVRDISLTASGLLARQVGGPSVRPPQPKGVYAFTQRRASWQTSKGADRYRRGMYTFFMRSAPYPMLTTFDTPKFNTTCTRRVRSNTPLQSLTMANDATMVEAAQALGRRLADAEGEVAEKLDVGWQRCFGRPINEEAREILADYYQQQQKSFLEAPKDALAFSGSSIAQPPVLARRAAWTAVARVMMNLDEFIVRE